MSPTSTEYTGSMPSSPNSHSLPSPHDFFMRTKARAPGEAVRSIPYKDHRGFVRINSPKLPHTPTFNELGRGRHSGKWLFNIDGWRRLFDKDDNQHYPQDQFHSRGQLYAQ